MEEGGEGLASGEVRSGGIEQGDRLQSAEGVQARLSIGSLADLGRDIGLRVRGRGGVMWRRVCGEGDGSFRGEGWLRALLDQLIARGGRDREVAGLSRVVHVVRSLLALLTLQETTTFELGAEGAFMGRDVRG